MALFSSWIRLSSLVYCVRDISMGVQGRVRGKGSYGVDTGLEVCALRED
jgi:hypothetical protein